MLGPNSISHQRIGHLMAQYSLYSSREATSVEAETSRVLSEAHDKKAPVDGQDELILLRQPANAIAEQPNKKSGDPTQEVGPDGKAFTPEEEKEIEELEDRDAEVKRHEQAHFQAASKYANSPKYEYQTGPDGKRYAVGGSVDIDISEVPNDPHATLEKARVIKRAALAPEEPSAQDRKVAREADQMASRAQRQISEERAENSERVADENASPEEAAPAKSLEEIAAEGIRKVSTPSLAPSMSEFAFDMVHRYKTSRLQMSDVSTASMETLASPSEGFLFGGLGRSFDQYI